MTTTQAPRRRPTTAVRVTALVGAMVLASGLVVERSTAAFTATTANVGNTFSTGSVRLTDDDDGSALFDVTGLAPLQTVTRCLEVTYDGTLAVSDPVRLYGGYADSPDGGTDVDTALAPYLDLVVEVGAEGTSCAAPGTPTVVYDSAAPTVSAGTLEAFTSGHGTWNDGVSTGWQPAGGVAEMRPFRVAMTVRDDDASQAKAAEPTFTWEVQSA